MDFKSIRKKAEELYKKGVTIEEINKKVGMPLTSDMIQRWINEDEYRSYKKVIFDLYQKQRKESNKENRRKILLKLKRNLEELLKIVPDDIDMQTKLMYTNINLGYIDDAKKIGDELLEKTDSLEALNGISIIEEKTKNYDKGIEVVDRMLAIEPNNEFYKSKKQRLQQKKENKKGEKDKLYAQIANLERNVRKSIERVIGKLAQEGKNPDVKKISKAVHKEVYRKIREISETILEKFPEEVIAKEKLVKSLYLIGEKDTAKSKGEEFLQTNSEDEIILWYMCKIEREQGNLQREKEYLEQLVKSSSQVPSLKVLKRLENVNRILEKQADELKIKEQTENVTEEDRQAWIKNIRKEFIYGNVTLKDIDDKIKEARKYPNYTKSLIDLLEFKTMITEDFQGEIKELDKFLETEPSISKEDYKLILDEMTRIKNQIEEKRIIDNYYDSQGGSDGGDGR